MPESMDVDAGDAVVKQAEPKEADDQAKDSKNKEVKQEQDEEKQEKQKESEAAPQVGEEDEEEEEEEEEWETVVHYLIKWRSVFCDLCPIFFGKLCLAITNRSV